MPKLVFLSRAKQDLKEISGYIARVSASAETARNFARRLMEQCRRLASYPVMMGRSRPELRAEYRSVPFGDYVIFLRYVAIDDDPIAVLQIVSIMHGSRDIEALFQD